MPQVTWQVTSAFPGRIRLQATASYRISDVLQRCATRIAEHEAVLEAFVAPEARSIVVRYESSTSRLRDVVQELLKVAQETETPLDPPASGGRQESLSATPLLVRDGRLAAGRSAMPFIGVESLRPLAPSRERSLAHTLSVTGTSIQDRPDHELIRVSRAPLPASGRGRAESVPAPPKSDVSLGAVVGRAVARAKSWTPHIRALDLPIIPRSFAGLVAPTIAVAAAAVELPAVLALAALAVASAPIAQRTVVSIRKRHFTQDSMDIANVVLLVFEGSVLQAGAITWLVQASDLMRYETMRKTRARMHSAAAIAGREGGEHRKRKTTETLEAAILGDSLHQRVWTKGKNSLSLPLAALALTAFAITRDPGYLIGLMRPRADFNAALCFGVPAPILTAMTRSAAHGPLLRNSAAVERLAQVDAVVFATVGTIGNEHVLGRRVRSLMQRNIRRFILPTEHQAAIVRRTADRAGIAGVVAEPMPADRHSVIRTLVKHGHHVALIDDGAHSEEDIEHADVHVVIDSGQKIPDSAHVVMAHADLHGLVHAIDASREAVHSIRHNTALAASAAGLNLMLSLVPPVAATAVNTAATAIMAARSLRSEKVAGPTERPPHLPHRRVRQESSLGAPATIEDISHSGKETH